MASSPNLFDSLSLGPYTLRNRIFMAPMTRGRATAEGVPTDAMSEYYRQRASAGLIITEATAISAQGVGWVNAPGIFTDVQQAAWEPVTEAVHGEGGTIFLQLWHMGRVSHPDFLDGQLPVSASAIAAEGESHTPKGKKAYVQPRALAADELPGVAADYAAAARRAIAAGFDGVEIHGANGYLLDQFIRDGSNQRDDAYGGSIENRWRFPLEVAEAVAEAVGKERTGIRLSPTNAYNGMSDGDPVATFSYGAKRLDALGLAFVHLLDPMPGHMFAVEGAPVIHPYVREAYGGRLILNGGYDAKKADEALAEGQADAVAFGLPFLANPDLPRRMQEDAPLNQPDFATLYTPGVEGYTDYPRLNERT